MTAMNETRPSWYTRDDDTAWERVKAAFRRDWRQTKHDFGGKQPDLKQDAGDTVAQATGSKPIPLGNMPNGKADENWKEGYREEEEPAYRYGYAAFRHHGMSRDWDADTEEMLSSDYPDQAEWERHRQAVRRGWYYAKNQGSDGCDL